MNGGPFLGRHLERQPPAADHHERRRGARVDAGRGLGELILLRRHLHLEVVEQQGHVGAAHGLPTLGDSERERVRCGRLVRGDQDLQHVPRVGDRLHDASRAHLRQRRVLERERGRRRRKARQHGRGEHHAQHHDDFTADQPSQQPRGGWAELRAPLCGDQLRAGPKQVARRDQHRDAEQPRLDEDRLAISGLPQGVDRWHVHDRLADAGGADYHHRAEGDVREPGYECRQGGDALASRDGPPQHEQTHEATQPHRSRREVEPVEQQRQPARRGLGRVTGGAGNDQHRGRREHRAKRRDQLGDGSPLAVGPVQPECDGRRKHEQREAQLQVDDRPPEGGHSK